MSLNRTIIDGYLAEVIPARSRNTPINQRPHLGAFAGLEKKSRRADELEGVPFDRIVARRDHEAARCVVIFHRELTGRCRREADVDYGAPD